MPDPGILRGVWNRVGWTLIILVEFAAILYIWENAVGAWRWMNVFYLAPPSAIGGRILEMINMGYLQPHLWFSIQNFVVGFVVAAAIGNPVGLLMGFVPVVRRALAPFVWTFYSTPRIALVPIVVVYLGFGMPSKVTIILLSAVFPMIVNAWAGAENVDQTLIRAGRVFGAKGLTMYTKVILPASLPFVLTGLRIGITRALIGMVLGEMFGSSQGLGVIVARAAYAFDVATSLAGTIIVIIMANIAVGGFRMLEQKLAPWRKELEQ